MRGRDKPGFRERFVIVFLPAVAWGGITALLLWFVFEFVSLKPRVDEHFFFSSEDPAFQSDKKIQELFPLPAQVILGVKGDIYSSSYAQGIEAMTRRLSEIPGVLEVQSLSRGPDSIYDAEHSPVWKRIIVSKDGKASFLFVLLENDVAPETVVTAVEGGRERFHRPDFEIMISGAPYIVELIRRHLLRDMRVFSLAAFAVFGLILLLIFHSYYILLGTLLACVNAGAVTLILCEMLSIDIGPLTANLATIVFVLTLSPTVFMTFNFRSILREKGHVQRPWIAALEMTFAASFWSMATTLLGFLSLLFVQATPLRQLGVSGAIGTVVAFAVAYIVHPFFLRMEALRLRGRGEKVAPRRLGVFPLYEKIRGWTVGVLIIITVALSLGIRELNADPSLFSYFKKGSEIREGMEYIDRSGGSVPLKIVITREGGERFRINHDFGRLWRLHEALEKDPAVGSVLSIPVILAEARTTFFTFLFTPDLLLRLTGNPWFITADRTKTLFLFRMNEATRDDPRLEVVKRLEDKIKASGLSPVLVGGIYLLQGKLTRLVIESIAWGLCLLLGLFIIMGFFLSHSFQVAVAMLVSLLVIPLSILGIIGHSKTPLDIISAPAVNVGIGMGVDAMIYMVIFVRRHVSQGVLAGEAWDLACRMLWRPILTNMIVVSVGFGVFGLSVFPPTQRFGLAVVMGTLVTPLVALFVLPCLGGVGFQKRGQRVRVE